MRIRCMRCMEEYDSYFEICPKCGTDRTGIAKNQPGLHPETILNRKYMTGLPLDNDRQAVTYMGYDLVKLKRVLINEYKVYPGLQRAFYEADVPGMIDICGTFFENEKFYIITEYMPGTSLHRYIEKKGCMGLEEALGFLMPVMEILDILHSKKIYHLKVNPNTILITEHREVMLMPPGVYQSVLGVGRDKNVREVERFFLAPEIMAGEGNGGSRADVYSVCAVLYTMLTGEYPLQGRVKKWGRKLHSLKKRGVDISASQINIITNGLLPENARTESMKELLFQLTTIKKTEKRLAFF